MYSDSSGRCRGAFERYLEGQFHLLDVVERVCDRMQILVDGKSVGVGTLDELRDKAGLGGSLEQVFGVLAATSDPLDQVRRLLGSQ